MISIKEYKAFKQAVSARELYELLGFDFSNWSRWCKKNIVNNEYALVNEDYMGFVIKTSGNETQDFALTIDFAKRLAMMAKTDKGEQARKYFIECEKKLHSVVNTYTFTESINAVSKQIDEIKQMGSAWGKVGASLKRTKKEARKEFKRLVNEAQYSLDLGFHDDLVSKEG
ncbi:MULTISPECIES: antA/AntB antirepressor family protein [Cysteiniphilum]|uniref:antA/AntB antirepressor family protein n=1 Tax=Cysteiniphilum TaxID=2056696 RepID=UPI0017848837|nr:MULTISPECIES: antA/AntB antirepressor family protein [Cysteiniphilum]